MKKFFTSTKKVENEKFKRKDEYSNKANKMSRKGEHGITLIALPITIIVILISLLMIQSLYISIL